MPGFAAWLDSFLFNFQNRKIGYIFIPKQTTFSMNSMKEILIEESTLLVKDAIKNILSNLYAEVSFFIENKMVEYLVENYNRNRFVKTLFHWGEPVDLIKIYQPLFLEEEKKKERISTISVTDIFHHGQYLSIVGRAGSGKSMLIRYLFIKSFEENYKIPIKIEFFSFDENILSIETFILERIFKAERIAENEKIIKKLLDSGKFIFFLDGYDELKNSQKPLIIRSVDSFVKKYNKNYFVISSRPYTDVLSLPLFKNFHISEFNGDEIKQFVKKQLLGEKSILSQKIIKIIEESQDKTFFVYLRNPLFLTMYIMVFEEYASIPVSKSEFYKRVFEVLFNTHDSRSKLAYAREKVSGLSQENIKKVLNALSYVSYANNKYVLENDYINDILNEFKKNNPEIPNFDNSSLIQDLKVAINVLIEEGGVFTFIHLSLQDYFAACFIKELNKRNKSIAYEELIHALYSDTSPYRHYNLINILKEIDSEDVYVFFIIPFLNSFAKKISLDELNRSNTSNKLKIFLIHLESLYTMLEEEPDINAFIGDQMNFIRNDYEKVINDYQNEQITQSDFNSKIEKLVDEKITPFLFYIGRYIMSKANEIQNKLQEKNSRYFNFMNLLQKKD